MELRHDDISLGNEFKSLVDGVGFSHMSFMVANQDDGLVIAIFAEHPLNDDDEAEFVQTILNIHVTLKRKYLFTPGMRFLFNLDPSQIVQNFDERFETTYDDAQNED